MNQYHSARALPDFKRKAEYPPAVHSMSTETRYEIIEVYKMRKLQECGEVWK